MSACASATLILAILSVESSYLDAVERPVRSVPDTVQFWLGSQSHWRIKTFAIDHDIHVHRIGDDIIPSTLTPDRAEQNIRKTYGDVIGSLHVLCVEEPIDSDAGVNALRAAQLPGTLEIAKAGFAFYKPDDARYRSQSQPESGAD